MFSPGAQRFKTKIGIKMFRSSAKTNGDVQHGPQGCSHPGASRPPRPGVDVPAQKLLPDARLRLLQSHLHRRSTLRQSHQTCQKRTQKSIKIFDQVFIDCWSKKPA